MGEDRDVVAIHLDYGGVQVDKVLLGPEMDGVPDGTRKVLGPVLGDLHARECVLDGEIAPNAFSYLGQAERINGQGYGHGLVSVLFFLYFP